MSRDKWNRYANTVRGLAASDVRVICTNTLYTPLIVTGSEIWICDQYPSELVPLARFSLANIKAVSLVEKVGESGLYTKNPENGGIRFEFKDPVDLGKKLNLAHEIDQPVSTFVLDVLWMRTYKNGQFDEAILPLARKGDNGPAKALVEYLSTAIGGVTSVGVLGKAPTPDFPASRAPQPAEKTAEERLRRLKDLLEKGLIDQSAYDQKRAEIMKEL